jgi:ribosomal protein S13
MARLVGVDLPLGKRVEIGLTYIYGIGRTRSMSLLHRAGVNPDTRVKDLTEEEVARLRKLLEEEGSTEGELPPVDRNRLLQGQPASPQPAGARPAHAHQRAHPQGPASWDGGE